jgi:dipeptide/tripeptide permease
MSIEIATTWRPPGSDVFHERDEEESAGTTFSEAPADARTLHNPNSSEQSWYWNPVIGCILAMEGSERFAYFGFRAILVIYFTQALQYKDNDAIAYFAYTTTLAYSSPVVGAIVADGYLGRYRTILYFSLVYLLGLIVLTGAASMTYFPDSAIGSDQTRLETQRTFTAIGLILVCVGTGGIKPCVSAFGADQVMASISVSSVQSVATEATRIDGFDQRQAAEPDSESPLSLQASVFMVTDTKEPQTLIDEIDCTAGDFDDAPRACTGTQQDSREEMTRTFFSAFYFCINIGATTSFFLVPIVRSVAGFGAAFGLSFLFMSLAVVLFVSQRHKYVHQHHSVGTVNDANSQASLIVLFHTCWRLLLLQLGLHGDLGLGSGTLSREARGAHHAVPTTDEYADEAGLPHGISLSTQGMLNFPRDEPSLSIRTSNLHELTDADENCADDSSFSKQRHPQHVIDAAMALHVMPILALFPVFWSLYDQQSSVWTLQASRMELHGLQPEQVNLVNPLQIMIFIPCFDRFLYPWLERRRINIQPLRRMAYGMILTAMAFTASGFVESAILAENTKEQSQTVSVFWQLPQITLLSIGEILFSITGLEFAYAHSPDRLKAFIMSCYLLTTAVGDSFSGILYSTVFTHLGQATVLHVCAALMVLNLVVFTVVVQWWEKRSYHDFLRN